MSINRAELSRLRLVVEAALTQASTGLSQMVGRPIQIAAPEIELVPMAEVAPRAGGPEQVVVAVYLGMTGQVSGHALLIFSSATARFLSDLLWEREPATAARSLVAEEVSALGEVGNLTISFFFNYLADRSNLTIVPTTPVVVEDMLGAVLDGVLAELSMYGDEALLLQTVFAGPGGEFTGQLVFLPQLETLEILMEALREAS